MAPDGPADDGAAAVTPKKRPAGGDKADAPHKVTKRRAARACVSCRARKVRCDVVEGAPCGNCRWDNVECIVQESRRRKKTLATATAVPAPAEPLRCRAGAGAGAGPAGAASGADEPRRTSSGSALSSASDGHVPHLIYQRSAGYRYGPAALRRVAPSDPAAAAAAAAIPSPRLGWDADRLGPATELPDAAAAAAAALPPFVRPLPPKMAPEDVGFLHAKGALSLPAVRLQDALLQAYVEFVHPYMPLMDLYAFLDVVARRDGRGAPVSLLLLQAVLFAATAFVDMKLLREAGYPTRKAARKAFFHKTRLLYDFDYESDRLVLVQALMLMTYWYETPDDQKDTWHWMGVAVSLAHTIGLHRNPAVTSMAPPKQRLWKRIWWSCFMRDRLIALGMRRPTRIKDEDFDVPMLVEDDLDVDPLPEASAAVVLPGCALLRDGAMLRELAGLCVQKAQLCVCVSHMLRTQYSVLIRDKMRPENTTNSTMMLFPNKQPDNVEGVAAVDAELAAWAAGLPPACRDRPLGAADVADGRATVAVQRTLLHMVYQTTVSALHRPQFLPSSPDHAPTASLPAQETSRLRVRDAAAAITRMAADLHHHRLERFLPTTGVTVILPAMIIHLLEMRNPAAEARDRAARGFRLCMRVMEKLRDMYAAADYATGFLDAALRKASLGTHAGPDAAEAAAAAAAAEAMKPPPPASAAMQAHVPVLVDLGAQTTPPPDNVPYMVAPESFFGDKGPDASPLLFQQQLQQQLQQHLLQQQQLQQHPQPHPHPQQQLAGAPAPPGQAAAVAMLPPNTVNAAALELSTTSPPHTDLDPAGLTPSASGGSDEAPAGLDSLDLDFMQGHDEFDWNAVAGTDFDVDQWLQFPPEGVGAIGSGGGGGGGVGAGGASDDRTGGHAGDGAGDVKCEDDDDVMDQVLSLALNEAPGGDGQAAAATASSVHVSAQA